MMVRPPAPLDGGPRPLRTPVFVGRKDELDLLEGVAANPPGIALLVGEAGVGKSRLVEEMFRRPRVRGRRQLLGHCHPLSEPLPLEPVVEALRSIGRVATAASFSPLMGMLRGILPELEDQFPPALEALDDVKAERHRMHRALIELMSALGPTVCVFEDLHWADRQTLDFLRALATALPSNLTLVVTYREEDLPTSSTLFTMASRPDSSRAVVRIQLAPLSVPEVGQLAGAILDSDDLSPDFTAYLHHQTAGLPFGVEEVLRLVEDRRDLLVNGDGRRTWRMLEALEVPWTVRESVLGRVARLGREARRVAEAAAVIGCPAHDVLVGEVAGLNGTRVARALAEAYSASVLVELEPCWYGFRHLLASQAVREAIPPPERQRLHMRVARALEGQTPVPVARVAHHFLEAGREQEWVHYAEAAADLAASRNDCESAVSLLKRVLAVPDLEPAVLGRMALKLAEAIPYSATPAEEAVSVLHGIIAGGRLPDDVCWEVRAQLGRLLLLAGQAAAGYRELKLCVSRVNQPARAIPLMLQLAAPWTVEGGHISDDLHWLERAIEAAAEQSPSPFDLKVSAYRCVIYLTVGDPEAWPLADQLPWEATSTAEISDVMWASFNLMAASFWLGHYGAARSFLNEATQRADQLGLQLFLVDRRQSAHLMLDWAEGRWLELADKAARHAHSAGDVAALALDRLICGSVAMATGDLESAERDLQASLDGAWGCGSVAILAAAAGAMARVHLIRDEPTAALVSARRGMDAVAGKGLWVSAGEVAPATIEALIACNRIAEAKSLAATYGRELRGRVGPLAAAALILCRGLLAQATGRTEVATQAYRRAARGYDQLGRPYDAAQAEARLGSLLLSVNDYTGADSLASALRAFEELGATRDAAQARNVLRRNSLVPPPHRRGGRMGRKGYGQDLSPRETEIVELAARGLSNAEIADAVFLSPRTIEAHLRRVTRKLGVRSRTALAARWSAMPPADRRLMSAD